MHRFTILLALFLFTACQSDREPATAPETTAPAPQIPTGGGLASDVAEPLKAGEYEDLNPQADPRPLEDLIRIKTPRPNDRITSPLQLQGSAFPGWFFEGDFPVVLTDEKGRVLAEAPAVMLTKELEGQFTPFASELTFDAPSGTRVKLTFHLDNPSDGEGIQRAVSIPLTVN